jgi:hypothetical protein
MKDTDYDNSVFGFNEHNRMWEHIVFLLDLNIKAETERAISPEMVGENRIHQCGRADALTNFKALLLEERKTARTRAGLTPE